jgi:mannose-1-phosphate guanylyltransferase/mannose-6-phosphate isomerase
LESVLIYPVILSGGTGTRLWPLSRKALPKQFLPLVSDHSLLQETALRFRGRSGVGNPVFVCHQDHRFLVAEQMREINVTPHVLMLEPVGRNTAPAIAVAALHLVQDDPDALLLVLASDHVIQDTPAFLERVDLAIKVAQAGYLTTFGITPQRPETGYGYIEGGNAISLEGSGEVDAYQVARFVEKPDLATAQEYVASGTHFWNSGMFVLPAQLLLDELEKFQPEVLAASRAALANAYSDLDFYRLDEASFSAAPSLSLDVAVMEKTDRAAVIPSDIGWNDVGSWQALWEQQDKDDNGNVVRGEAFLHNSRNCYVNAEKRLVAAVGVENLVVVETADAILVLNKEHSQDVKKIVDWLQDEKREEHLVHRKVYRPWGSYEGIERGDRFQVKRLIVKPGEKSSMQMHHHRAEHWVVVSGTAEVALGDEVHLVAENQSIYIPLGITHRIHNPGRIPLHFIEVQSGAYLEEDDIVRIDDKYGR